MPFLLLFIITIISKLKITVAILASEVTEKSLHTSTQNNKIGKFKIILFLIIIYFILCFNPLQLLKFFLLKHSNTDPFPTVFDLADQILSSVGHDLRKLYITTTTDPVTLEVMRETLLIVF